MIRTLAAVLTLATGAFLSSPQQSRTLERHYQVTPSQRIELRGISGSEIEFKSWDKEEVSIKLDVRISSSDEEYEKEYIDALDIVESHDDGKFSIEFKELRRGVSGSGIWSIFKGRTFLKKEIRGEVYVPRSNALTTDFSYGAVTLEGMKGQIDIFGKSNKVSLKNCESVHTIENDYGTTEIDNSNGNLKLSGTSSSVTVTTFKGPLSIEANYSTIRLKDIGKSSTVQTKSGKVTAENIGGDLVLRADYSQINVLHVAGLFDVTSKSGSIRVQDAKGFVVDAPYSSVEATGISGIAGKQVTVTTQSSPVVLEDIASDVEVNAPYSTISLKRIRGSANITSKSGRVDADDVSGDWISRTEYSSIVLRNLRSKSVMITNKSAGVELGLSVVPSSVTIRNEYGSVAASVPKGFSGEITLDAEYGSVETDFPIRIKNRGSSGYGIGKVGTGNGSISIETKSGNIELTEQ